MDKGVYPELQSPSGILTRLHVGILNDKDAEKMSVFNIEAANGVTDPRLGLPNPTRECFTCGATDLRSCEGHFAVIKFPFTVLHPYFISETAQVLNKICPGCKSVRGSKSKDVDSRKRQLRSCKYCDPRMKQQYPRIKFKVSKKEVFDKTAIIAEVDESNSQKKPGEVLAADFWDIVPNDTQVTETLTKPSRRVFSHAQVYHMLKDVDSKIIKDHVRRKNSLFLNCFLVTPNCHRVTEFAQKVTFDERTRAFRKLVDFRGNANELSTRVLEGLKTSKIRTEKPSTDASASSASGLKHVKELVLGKRSDHAFRMVVVGDPSLELSEIGVPRHIAERLHVSEHLNLWNRENLKTCCDLRIMEKGEVHVRRKDGLISINSSDKLQIGDIVYRPLRDGDTVLINRPPSIHSHSFIALSVKQIPSKHSYSVLAINPLICSPFRADFDGDCIHGYVPQSMDARVELQELVALGRQLTDAQSGRNLISFCQDSLTAAHLLVQDGVYLDVFQMQQLQMFCSQQLPFPAIISKLPPLKNSAFWTGKQLFSLFLPQEFDYNFPPSTDDNNISRGKSSSEDVRISKGELLITSEGSSWLRDSEGNFFQHLFEHHQEKALDLLYNAQEVLCNWISSRGLSVSLSDLYLSSDKYSRAKMIDEVLCGLQEAERVSHIKLLMVDSNLDFLIGHEESLDGVDFNMQRMSYEKQKSAALSQLSVSAFKKVFCDIQNLLYEYSGRNNSLLTMLKAGSKGNLMKLVQHSMCLGLQHSLVPLSFTMPHQLSCVEWNRCKANALDKSYHNTECAGPYIPSAVVESSFLTGLSPLECFVHSVVTRDSSFSDNADLPGTLNRRLMFFMRELYIAYDKTVRNTYGNQLVQFSYYVDSAASSSTKDVSSLKNAFSDVAMAGQSVGSLAACAISEAAYSALDQPISALETSPLLNLKKALECGSKSKSGDKTATLFLSKKLGRKMYGFEYAALEIRSYLEGLTFSAIVSSVMICFSPQTPGGARTSPWVCHFHIRKDLAKKRRLSVCSIVDALCTRCNSDKSKTNFPKLQISSKDCSAIGTKKEQNATFCITITMIECARNTTEQLDTLRDMVIPSLLGIVVKGFPEFKKVDILWKDQRLHRNGCGELFLRVFMLDNLDRRKFWSSLMNNCLRIMDMIDWERSHPDDVHDMTSAYGIDTARTFFLNNLVSAISETGKTILPEHVRLAADCLSATGEFVGLNAKGLAYQRRETSVSSPFSQACFSNPADCLIKAAKRGAVDELQGSLDALSWGKTPSIGTGGRFEILYSKQEHGIDAPKDVYALLLAFSQERNAKFTPPVVQNFKSDKGYPRLYTDVSPEMFKTLQIPKSILIDRYSSKDILWLSQALKNTLHNNPIDHRLNEVEKNCAMMALSFHPRKAEKIGSGTLEIKVGLHSVHESSRCFWLVRSDGTKEDFSYHKCIHRALEIIAPKRAKTYQSRWLNGKVIGASNDSGIYSKL